MSVDGGVHVGALALAMGSLTFSPLGATCVLRRETGDGNCADSELRR